MAPARPCDASPPAAAGVTPRLRVAACFVALAAVGVMVDSQVLADPIDAGANQSTLRWSTAKKKALRTRRSEPAKAPASGRLKWRAPKSTSAAAKIEPRTIEEPVEAAPLATVELRSPTVELRSPTGESLMETTLQPQAADQEGEQPGVIMLTTGELPVVDPFSDPFGDNEAKPADPSQLELFPVMTTGTLQSVDDEQRAPGTPGKLDAPDESLLEQMRAEQAPPEEMPSRNYDEELGLPSDEELAQNPAIQTDKCPAPRDLKPISEITNQIAAEPGIFPQECTLGDEPFQPRNFAMKTYTWKASALCHKPLYFEQPGVERYGHTFGPFLQPVVSSGHFFASVLMLPYKMGLEPPWECVYPLGFYRPGSCAPYTVGPVPISLRGIMNQAGATLGFVYVFAP